MSPNAVYNQCNKLYYKNRLPKIKVVWADLPDNTYGHFVYPEEDAVARIELNSNTKKDLSIWIPTLLHEMVHVYMWLYHPRAKDHGTIFNREMRRLAALGALDDLW
jgi:predicted SprT family Zn-dependent metalloprotease